MGRGPPSDRAASIVSASAHTSRIAWARRRGPGVRERDGESRSVNTELARVREREALAVTPEPLVDLGARSGSMRDNEPYDWASPWMFDRWQRLYLAGKDPSDPLASPGLADLTGIPPLLVQVGTAELLLDQVRALAERARRAGVELTLEEYAERVQLWHTLTPMFPEFQASIDAIGRFVQRFGSGA